MTTGSKERQNSSNTNEPPTNNQAFQQLPLQLELFGIDVTVRPVSKELTVVVDRKASTKTTLLLRRE